MAPLVGEKGGRGAPLFVGGRSSIVARHHQPREFQTLNNEEVVCEPRDTDSAVG